MPVSLRACGPASIFMLATLGGCMTLQDPRVTVRSASEAERTDEAIVLDVAVEIENPNAEPLDLREVEYLLSLDGKAVFRARRAGGAAVSPHGTRTLTIPAVIPLAAVEREDADGPAATWRLQGTILYLPPGEIREIFFDAGLYRPRTGLRGEGPMAMERASVAP